jgi:hypothetical protein
MHGGVAIVYVELLEELGLGDVLWEFDELAVDVGLSRTHQHTSMSLAVVKHTSSAALSFMRT